MRPGRRPARARQLALALLLAAVSTSATAADHLLAGTKLVAKAKSGKKKFLWTSKDAVPFPSSAPSSVGALLVVTASDGDTASVTLGSANWTETPDATRAKYSNRDAPGGDSPCRAALIKNGKLLKIACSDDLIDTLDPGAEVAVAVRLTVGSDNYCAAFGGKVKDVDGSFSAKGAPAPAACDEVPPIPTTTVTFVQCPTTTVLLPCGFGGTCSGLGRCPSGQQCTDNGAGGCACVGPAVPCGNVFAPLLCVYGDCPPEMECVSIPYTPPDCRIGCECR